MRCRERVLAQYSHIVTPLAFPLLGLGLLMADFAASQPVYIGLDERERGPADELPALAAAGLVTAASLADSDRVAVVHLIQVG